MYKIIFLTTMLLLSIVVFSQNKNKEKQTLDSCCILKKLVKKNWIYQKKGNYFKDTLGMFYHSELYPAFTKCLINKSKKEIIKLLGKPSHYNSKDLSFYFKYCLSPNNKQNCCYDFLNITFDNKWRVKEAIIAGSPCPQPYLKQKAKN